MSIGLGILVVALPLYMVDVGLSFTATTIVLGAVGVGGALGALPSGSIIDRHGESRTLAVAFVLMACGTALTAATTQPVVLAALQLSVGVVMVSARLAAQTHVTRTVGVFARGRALSGMGGIRRLGAFVGPLVGGVLVDGVGFTWTFLIAGGITALAVVPQLLHFSADDAQPAPGATDVVPSPAVRHRAPLLDVFRQHWRLLVSCASGPFLIMTARRGRSALLPLIADNLGASATANGAIVAIGTGADLLLFPVAGWLMDRFGRLFAIVPAFSIMAIGLLLLGFADSTTDVALAGIIIGVGNGMSAGTMMTVASDQAPTDAPAPFIAAYATITDFGGLTGPLLVGLIGDAVGLSTSSIALAVTLVFGIGLIARSAKRNPPIADPAMGV